MMRASRQILKWCGGLIIAAVIYALVALGVFYNLCRHFGETKEQLLATHWWGVDSLRLYTHASAVLICILLVWIAVALYVTKKYFTDLRKSPFSARIISGKVVDSFRTIERRARINKTYLQDMGLLCVPILAYGIVLYVLLPLPF